MDAKLLERLASRYIKLLASRYEMLEIESQGEHQCLYHFKNKGHHVEAEIFMSTLAFELCISEDYDTQVPPRISEEYNAQLPPHGQVRWQMLENSGKIRVLSES